METLNNSQTPEPTAQTQPTSKQPSGSLAHLSATELVEHLAILLQQEELPERKSVDGIKLLFYKKKETALVQQSDQAENLEIQETRLNDLLATFKALDRKRTQAIEEAQQAALELKGKLINELEALLESAEDFGKIYARYHELREQWQAAGEVPAQHSGEMSKRFLALQDRFYDLKSINEELREYDFKKNLEARQAILEKLRELTQMEDPIQALRSMQSYIKQWEHIGPVAKELRTEIHNAYKELTGTIYKRHQEHFDQKKVVEQENLRAKEEICTEIEQMLMGALPTSVKLWEQHTQRIHELQEKWRTIGYASKKENDNVYRRFRAALDVFFRDKGEFYDRHRKEQAENLRLKRELIDKAIALKDRTDWQRAANELKALQEEWSKIGSVPNRVSKKIWEEFRAPFDYFFDRRKAIEGNKRQEEHDHLVAKKAIIERLRALAAENDLALLRRELPELNKAWQEAGHVPYFRKERIQAEYKALLDELYGRLRNGRPQRRDHSRGTSGEGHSSRRASEPLSERQKLQHQLDRLSQELNVYERNISSLSISSLSGSDLLKEVEHKRDQLREEIEHLSERIAQLRDQELKD